MLIQFSFSSRPSSLTMDTRTYYFYAETAKEADEWINILQWKLASTV